MEYKIEQLPAGTRVFTTNTHRFGSDALLLAEFCEVRRSWAVADLCAGCGIVLLCLIDSGLQGPCAAVEIEPEAAALIELAAEQNQIKKLQVVKGDLCCYRPGCLFDLVSANPPYFNKGLLPQSPARAKARHEESLSLEELCQAAARLLKDGGRFCLCYPPARLGELFWVLGQHKLAPKRLRLVRKAPDAAPWLALVDARKNGGVGLTVLPECILPPGATTTF